MAFGDTDRFKMKYIHICISKWHLSIKFLLSAFIMAFGNTDIFKIKYIHICITKWHLSILFLLSLS